MAEIRPNPAPLNWREVLARQLSYLTYGFIFWLPVLLVIYVLSLFFNTLDNAGKNLMGIIIPEEFLFTGAGFILSLLVVYFSGMILKRPGPARALANVPVIGPFFSQGNVMTLDKLAHLMPCIFLYSPTCISYGWVLSEEGVTGVGGDEDFNVVNIYYPNVPTLVTGQVFAARRDTVIRLGNTSSEIIYLLLYSFRTPVALKYVPWDDESPEHFNARKRSFGLIFEHGDMLGGAMPSSRLKDH